METTLLRTKLHIPPTRPALVSRPRLIERLNAGLLGKLSLISAPAGFGKTTLVNDWVRSGVRSQAYGVEGEEELEVKTSLASHALLPTARFAWLSLDEDDNDLNRFLVYFVAALQTIKADMGKGVLSALQSPQPPRTEAVLTVLINEITAYPDLIIFVLDDYHLIEIQTIHDALAFLLRHLPPQMHLTIVTREDPPLPLSRLRVRGQLTEVRAKDLRFNAAEAAEFFNQVIGLNLLPEDITALDKRTEGWIAGLQLAGLALHGTTSTANRKNMADFIQSFTGGHHFVLDYLVEEVLGQQSESIQSFLLQTAILNRLTGDLCDAVCFGIAPPPTARKRWNT